MRLERIQSRSSTARYPFLFGQHPTRVSTGRIDNYWRLESDSSAFLKRERLDCSTAIVELASVGCITFETFGSSLARFIKKDLIETRPAQTHRPLTIRIRQLGNPSLNRLATLSNQTHTRDLLSA